MTGREQVARYGYDVTGAVAAVRRLAWDVNSWDVLLVSTFVRTVSGPYREATILAQRAGRPRGRSYLTATVIDRRPDGRGILFVSGDYGLDADGAYESYVDRAVEQEKHGHARRDSDRRAAHASAIVADALDAVDAKTRAGLAELDAVRARIASGDARALPSVKRWADLA